MEQRVPADSGDARRRGFPDGQTCLHENRRLGRYPIRDYALTHPCCLRQPEDSRRPRAQGPEADFPYVRTTAWTPRGFAGSIRTLGPIVDDTASDLM
jgi:hypothetical protein